MKRYLFITRGLVITLAFACNEHEGLSKSDLRDSLSKKDTIQLAQSGSVDSLLDQKDSLSLIVANDSLALAPVRENETIETKDINPEDVIRFAETLVGTPYVYGS